ncbi:hypothetical protein BDV06DRAFT_184768 [Aspergillus oleicola]
MMEEPRFLSPRDERRVRAGSKQPDEDSACTNLLECSLKARHNQTDSPSLSARLNRNQPHLEFWISSKALMILTGWLFSLEFRVLQMTPPCHPGLSFPL